MTPDQVWGELVWWLRLWHWGLAGALITALLLWVSLNDW